MLRFYDKPLLLSALAFAALAGPAQGDTAAVDYPAIACDLTDGHAIDPAGFAAEAATCTSTNSAQVETQIGDTIAILTERARARAGMAPLQTRASLNDTARFHAMDMAARNYAGHVSPEGLNHLDRMRRLDRRILVGASGANIAIVERGTSGIDAFNELIGDQVNADNLTRNVFTHSGVGVAEAADGRLVIVQVFAQVDGELDAPLALSLASSEAISAHFADERFSLAGWRLSNTNTGAVTRGSGKAINPNRLREGTAYLNIDASLGAAVYELSGPAVSIR